MKNQTRIKRSMGDKNSKEKSIDKLMDASIEFRMQAKQMEKEA